MGGDSASPPLQAAAALLTRTEQSFGSSGEVFGVVVTRDGDGPVHSGIVFRRPGGMGAPAYLHVKWDKLVGGSWTMAGIWTTPNDGSDDMRDRLASASELADQILRQHRGRGAGLPYGIGWRGSTFAWGPGGTVMLRTAPGTFGLTCATLVLAVCKYAGVDLIAEETWEPRPDRDRELVLLAERFGPPGLAAQFLAEIAAGARRIRPEEMVGACCCVPLPAGFADVQPLAASVLGLLGAGAKTHASETRLERNTTHAGLTP